MPYKDPEKRKEAFRKYYEKNKEKLLKKNRQWAKDNPEKARDISNRSYARRVGELIVTHETIDEALDNLLQTPKPEPEPLSKSKLKVDEEKLNRILNELKEGLD